MNKKQVVRSDSSKELTSIKAESQQIFAKIINNLTRINDIPIRHTLHLTGGHVLHILTILPVPKTNYFLTGSKDTSIRLWDEKTGQTICVFQGHTNDVTSLSFCSGTQKFISAGRDGSCILWDIESGKAVKTFKKKNIIVNHVMAFPDGKLFISIHNDHTIQIWDIEKSAPVNNINKSHGINHIAISNDAEKFYAGTDLGKIIVFDKNFKIISDFYLDKKKFKILCLSNSGDMLACGTYDGAVYIFEPNTLTLINNIFFEKLEIKSLEFDKNDERLLVGIKHGMLYWIDIKNNKPVLNYGGPNRTVSSLYFFDEDHIISSSWAHSLKIAISTGNTEIIYTPTPNADQYFYKVKDGHVSPDGKYVVHCDSKYRILLFDREKGKILYMFLTDKTEMASTRSVRFSNDSRYLVAALDWEWVYVWEIDSKKLVYKNRIKQNIVGDAILIRDNKYIVAGGRGFRDSNLVVRNIKTNKAQYLSGHDESIFDLCLSPDSKYFISGGGDGAVCLWDAETLDCLHTFHFPGVCKQGSEIWVKETCFSGNSQYIAASDEAGEFYVWEITSKKLIASFFLKNIKITSIALNYDGSQIAVGTDEHGIKLFSIKDQKPLSEIPGNWHRFYHACLNSSRDRVLVAANNHTLSWPLNNAVKRKTYGHVLRRQTAIHYDELHDQLYIAAYDMGIKKINLKTFDSKYIHNKSIWVSSMITKPGGQSLFFCRHDDISVREINSESGERNLALFNTHNASCMAYAPKTRRFFVGYSTFDVQEWDLLFPREKFRTAGLDSEVTALAVSKDEEEIFVAGESGMIQLVDINAGEGVIIKTWNEEHSPINAMVMREDGELLASGNKNGTLYIYNSETTKRLNKISFKGSIEKIQWIGSDDFLVVGLSNGSILLMNTQGEIIRSFKGHQVNLAITGLGFRKENEMLISSSHDGTTCFWDLESGDLLGKFYFIQDKTLFTTPADNKAPQGWFYTDSTELISFVESDEDGKNLKPSTHTMENQQYYRLFNNKHMVIKRILDYKTYQQELKKIKDTIETQGYFKIEHKK